MANKSDIYAYLSGKHLAFSERGDEFWMDCPKCGEGRKDGSFSVTARDGAFNCKRGSCGVCGSFYGLKKLFGDTPDEPYCKLPSGSTVSQAKAKIYVVPPAVTRSDDAATEAKEWLESRSINPSIAKQFGVLPVTHNGGPALAFPYIRNGKHVHTKYRCKNGKKPNWKNFTAESGSMHCLYGIDLIPSGTTDLIIVEGELDAIAMKCMGFPAVSMPDGIDSIDEFVSIDFDWLQRFKTIYLAVDMDVKEDALMRLARRLGPERCKRVEMPYKDANDCLINGWGSIEVQTALEYAKDMKPKQLKHSADFAREYYQSRFSENSAEKNTGTPWRLPGLNDYLLGKRPGSMTMLPGYNFAGKTTAVLQEMGDDCAAGVKCLFLCLEISAFEALDWLLEQQCNKRLHLLTGNDHLDSLDGFLRNLWWMEPHSKISEEDMMEVIRYSALRYGVEVVYIDNLTCVGFRKDDFNAQAEFARKIKFDVARALGIHVIVIVHTRKAQNMQSVSGDRNDIAGAKELSDLADNVVIAKRNEEKDEAKRKGKPTTQLIVDKNRFGKKQGIIDLTYQDHNNRFTLFKKSHNPTSGGYEREYE